MRTLLACSLCLLLSNLCFAAAGSGRLDAGFRKIPSQTKDKVPFRVNLGAHKNQIKLPEPCATYAGSETLDPQIFRKLEKELRDDRFSVREAATDCLADLILTRHGDYIVEQLSKSLERKGSDSLTLEQSSRMKSILSKLSRTVKCSLKNTKILLYSGATPGRLTATSNVAASIDLPAEYSLEACVSNRDAEALTQYDWTKNKDPWGLGVAMPLFGAIVAHPDALSVVTSRVPRLTSVRFARNGSDGTEISCTQKPGKYCQPDSYDPPEESIYECSYSCFCGTAKLISSYDVEAVIGQCLAGAGTLDNFPTAIVCPDVCASKGSAQFTGPLLGVDQRTPRCARSAKHGNGDIGAFAVTLREELVPLTDSDRAAQPELPGLTVIPPTHKQKP